jgi:hypothetical protein
MSTPVIVSENGDLMIFKSVEQAQAALEPIDVKNGEYVAYDSEGFLLAFEIVRFKKNNIFRANHEVEAVELKKSTKHCPKQLSELLIQFFKNTNTYVREDDSAKLQDLIQKAISNYGYVQS